MPKPRSSMPTKGPSPPKKKGRSLWHLIGGLVVVMLGIQYVVYTSLDLSPSVDTTKDAARAVSENKEVQAKDPRKALDMTPYHTYDKNDQTAKLSPKEIQQERKKTAKRLEHMDVTEEYLLEELPPWSQILDNFHPQTRDDEPVILGLEHCAAFRAAHNKSFIGFAPAGMFSTGTNLITQLGKANCHPPNGRVGGRRDFVTVQVQWGKHNPADARNKGYRVAKSPIRDRTAIMPVVAIRHPYTWMTTMCSHSYGTRWKHIKPRCHEMLNLTSPIFKVPYGFKNFTNAETGKVEFVKNTYDNLARMWLDWYKPYFLADQHQQSPRLMVRHEDMVYRPEKVMSKVCECVGGYNPNTNNDWQGENGFSYQEEVANKGKGHGKHRSGLLTAIIKYGQPLRNWYDQYTAKDREIMKSVFQGESDPALLKIFDTFQYKLFDDVEEPTKRTKAKVARRIFLEKKQKENRENKSGS